MSATVPPEDDHPNVDWALALAGGDGGPLQDYVERRFGRRIPKQYCQVVGSRSVLEHTLARLNALTPASRTLTVIGADHTAHAMPQLSGASHHVFRQPASGDTGLALYVALAMIKRWTPNAIVTITPTDHFVEPSVRYVDHHRVARVIAARARDRVAILGGRPDEPDPDLRYLNLGRRALEAPEGRRLTGVVVKPTVARAQELIATGALWNTMVACGTVDALWSIGRAAQPHLMGVLDCLVPLIGTRDESDAIDYIYRAYQPVSFSTDIFERTPEQVVVLELDGVNWSDLGTRERVEHVLALRRLRARTPERVAAPRSPTRG